jgi:hypothetical protein
MIQSLPHGAIKALKVVLIFNTPPPLEIGHCDGHRVRQQPTQAGVHSAIAMADGGCGLGRFQWQRLRAAGAVSLITRSMKWLRLQAFLQILTARPTSAVLR